jgi:hypothetical protein
MAHGACGHAAEIESPRLKAASPPSVCLGQTDAGIAESRSLPQKSEAGREVGLRGACVDEGSAGSYDGAQEEM